MIFFLKPRRLVAGFLLILMSFACAATTLDRGVSPAIKYENKPNFKEVFRIKIENRGGGTIEVSEDEGESWKPVGQVLFPTEKVSAGGFAAARWMSAGRVVATAVNAIHIKTGESGTSKTVFSVLPRDFLKPPAKYKSFLSPDSSIYTDIAAGEGIFGGGYSPFVGNNVLVSRPGVAVGTIPKDYVPAAGDKFYILVDRPTFYPKELTFENRFGGRVMVTYFSGGERIVGEVLRPVVGIGRFEGTEYIDPGRIRANHPGVIDISVSPRGSIGGFQIVPALHGDDLEYVKTATQWMVIGPSRASDPSLEGMAPFFKFFIRPSYSPSDLEDENWDKKLAERFLVEVKYSGQDKWNPMPIFSLRKGEPLPEWANTALKNVTHFRILFPVAGDGVK